jgi:glycosyltransferase involved in cell wall biosynthesis
MRIGLIYDRVYPWLNGGGEKTLWEIALELKNAGDDVHYFGTKFWDGPNTIVREGVTLHGVCRRSEFYRSDGNRTIIQPLLFAWGLLMEFWRQRHTRFDLINCTVFPYFSVLAVCVFRVISGCRFPWMLTWFEVWGWRYWQTYLKSRSRGAIGFLVEWLCAKSCKTHLVISPLQAGRLRRLLRVPSNQIHVLPRGVDLRALPAKVRKRRHRVLYAGRLAPYKNLQSVLIAWPGVLIKCPDATLRIIGSGPTSGELQDLILRLGIGDCVEILPPLQSPQAILEQIANADVFVQPSIREGQSVTVIEAMAVGTAVIASKHQESAVSDLIEHEQNGILVHQWNEPRAWENWLVRLLEDTDFRTKLILAGRKTATEYDLTTKIIPRLAVLHAKLRTGDALIEEQSAPAPSGAAIEA